VRVEYSLTPLGWAATEMLIALADWAEKHWVDVDSARARYDDARTESSEQSATPASRAA
jgi:DNA-binding HxlR family transcriptional regulator